MPDGAAVGRLAVNDYLDALARLMITEDLGAWTPSLRSKARLRTRPVRPLADPPVPRGRRIARDPQGAAGRLGLHRLAVREHGRARRAVYLDATGGKTYHYRDSTGLEVDIIVELDDAR